ncbi:uncharacterized protein LOC127864390 isoform X2 [Dreissena polymorpha]|uniref:uncharacterized protein LOC127864390 isoform X2 n=1 Tax=Dreissena polymorpha TaxID=45954 RepID=UPI00226501B4|nr:uncharacterized protein LOC127864390 isoform X2 [Dreissena polymorpha]
MTDPRHLVYWSPLLGVIWLGSVCCQDECIGQDQCSCQYSDGRGVYLNSLGHTDGTPAFKDIKGDDGSVYSYNPCYPFSEGGSAQVAACQTNTIEQSSDIGDQQTAQLGAGDSGLEVGYTAGRGLLTATTVQLVCDLHACKPIMTAQGATGLNSFTLTLKTVCACPGACNEAGPLNPCTGGGGGGGGISGGVVFLIIFACLLLIYIIGGVSFMKFVRRAEGKELLPNYGFWSNLPGYIKSGTLFVISPCRKKSASYNSI